MSMRTNVIVAAAAIILVLLVVGAVFLFRSEAPADMTNPSVVTFPTASSTGTGGQGGTTTLGGEDGVVINNFLNNGVTVEDLANEGNYYLAGQTGYCNDDGTCVSAGDDAGYNIVYFSEDNSFVISLTREPLGEVRRDAEQFLMQTLGVNQETLCTLRVYIGTTVYVSEVYGSIGNLGISSCPNATALPI